MSDDDSLFGSIRRTLTGPAAAEEAAALKERLAEEPASADREDLETLVGLLDADDPEAVSDALYALESFAAERPALASEAAPAVVADLSNRPAEAWEETSLREMSDAFMRDLARGSVLLTLARDDPAHLNPVADTLAEKYDAEDALEPHSLLALAHVVAAGGTDLPREPFVDWVATELEAAVESEDEFGIQIAETVVFVELLADLGGADALAALGTARDESDDEAVVAAADDAIERLDG